MKIKLHYFTLIILFFYSNNYCFANTNINWKEKVSSDLLNKLEQKKTVDFIVYFDNQIELNNSNNNQSKTDKATSSFMKLRNKNLNSQTNIIDILNRLKYQYKQYYIVNAILVNGDLKLVKILANMREVAYIAYDSPTKQETNLDENISYNINEVEPTWGIRMIKADQVWDLGYKGEGVVVGGQDTGYDWMHPALLKKYRGYVNNSTANHDYNWHDAIHEINPLNNDSIILPTNNPCGLNSTVPCDDHSHGTHTMGTMIGRTDSMLIGVAPESKWIGCRNMERGWGKPSTYIECYEWFLAPTDINGLNPDPELSPDVINNSWSCPVSEGCDSSNWSFMEIALNNLRASGVFVVVSAGNEGIRNCGSIDTPSAIFENSFTVGATRLINDTTGQVFNDTIANFSSRGPVTVDNSYRLKPDISAPGQNVLSARPNNNYSYASGTSMAGPHVVGVIALILSANPDLKGYVEKITEILKETADPKYDIDSCRGIEESVLPNSTYGYGRINALAAVNKALELRVNTEDNEKYNNKDISIFPNPFYNNIDIKTKNEFQNMKFELFDSFGRKLKTKLISNNTKIDLTDLKTGIYLVKINSNNMSITKKIIKI